MRAAKFKELLFFSPRVLPTLVFLADGLPVTLGIILVCIRLRRTQHYLAVDLLGPLGGNRSLLTKVVHARDLADGTWHVGCEFVKPLTDSQIEIII